MLTGLLERFRDWRNRKVADPSFRRWASRFPLTRRIARREANALFDLTAGFVYSQVLAACIKVDLFEMLAAGPCGVEAIAARSGLPCAGAERLMKAAAALDLVEARRGGAYALGSLGAALVGNDGVKAMVLHHDLLYEDLRDPVALLSGKTGTALNRYWSYAARDQDPDEQAICQHAEYTRLMARSQAFVAAEILDAYPIRRHRRLLDVGGGDASFLIAAGKAAPDVALSLFDLPAVARIARERIEAAGLSGRAEVFGGSFLTDPLPDGADLITLNRVLHDHDDPSALAILRSIRRAIAPDGTLLISEPMAGTRGAEASGDAYFGFYLLAMGQGRPRTAGDVRRLLTQSGFGRVREIPTSTPLIVRSIAARPVFRRATA